jgi:hypothetical protein
VTRKERRRRRGSNRERAARLPIHRAISDARIELALEDKHLWRSTMISMSLSVSVRREDRSRPR